MHLYNLIFNKTVQQLECKISETLTTGSCELVWASPGARLDLFPTKGIPLDIVNERGPLTGEAVVKPCVLGKFELFCALKRRKKLEAMTIKFKGKTQWHGQFGMTILIPPHQKVKLLLYIIKGSTDIPDPWPQSISAPHSVSGTHHTHHGQQLPISTPGTQRSSLSC